MAGAGPFDPAFVQNVHAENAELFDMAIRAGVTVIVIQLGGRGGIQAINYTYDKVKKYWKGEPKPAEQNVQLSGSLNSVEDLAASVGPTKKAFGFEDIALTPDSGCNSSK